MLTEKIALARDEARPENQTGSVAERLCVRRHCTIALISTDSSKRPMNYSLSKLIVVKCVVQLAYYNVLERKRKKRARHKTCHPPRLVFLRLDQELLNLELDGLNLSVQLPSLVGGDTGGNDSPRDTTSSAESSLAGQKDVGDVLVLTEERKVEQDLDGLSVSGHDDELADTTVEGLVGCR